METHLVCVYQLMKLNEEWDHIYHSTSVSLQQRVADFEEENAALKQLKSRLLLKVEHEQVRGQTCLWQRSVCNFSIIFVPKQKSKYC